MNEKLQDLLLQSLIDQKEIFGDELFETKNLKRRTSVEFEPKIQQSEVVKSQKEIISEKILSSKNENLKEIPLIEEPKEKWQFSSNLDELNKLICECQKCPLGKTRNKFVFGTGNPNADVLVVGEGPGADEDAQGLPFVGRAGKLLTDILKAINFSREEVYIANIVKCRPPANRTPLPAEMESCLPYLNKQIELINPKVILCLGLTSALGLLKKRESLTNLRGKVFDFGKAKVMVTYHPAALLRNPNWKRGCWEDVQLFRKLYDEMAQLK